MNNILLELHYLPTIEYFCEIAHSDAVIIEANESYQKQTYRNRTKILCANKIMNLSVPVKQGRKHIPIRDVQIEYSEQWINQHIRSIVSSYNKSPFFEHYWDYIRAVLEKKHNYLFDLNLEILTICLKLIGLQKEVILSKGYKKHIVDGVIDYRSVYSPKNKKMPNWQYSYTQVFGNKFVQQLSIIDLLFSVGPQTKKLLIDATRTKSF